MKSWLAMGGLLAASSAFGQAQYGYPIPAKGFAVFGIMDLGVGRTSSAGGGSAKQTFVASSDYSGSRLGFRGTEDLGDGLSASFWLEAGMNPDTGSGKGTNTNNQASGDTTGGGLTFGRASWVSLNGPWGSVRFGRDFTAQHWNIAIFDAFALVGIGAAQTVGGVSVPLTSARGPFAAGNSVALPGSFVPTRVRASNSISYFTPGSTGFYGWGQYYFGENPSNAAAGANAPGTGKDDGTGWGLRVGYTSGPMDVALATSKIKLALFGDWEMSNIGGSWDFGWAKLMAVYNRDRADGSSLAGGLPGPLTGKSWSFGGVIPLGLHQVRAAYSSYRMDMGSGVAPQTDKLALSYSYFFSKRTNAYANFALIHNKNGANTVLSGSIPGPGVVNQNSSGFVFGVRHIF